MFQQTGTLLRFLLRLDRIKLGTWLAILIVSSLLTLQSLSDLYPEQADRDAMIETMQNPVMIAIAGKSEGLDHYGIGTMFAHQMILFTALAVGIMAILLTARRTRGEEEDGQLELLRSMPTGRQSQLAAVSLAMLIAFVLLALGLVFGIEAMQAQGTSLAGSLLYGAALGVIGLFFTGLTACFAQLSSTSRGTIGLSFGALIFFYLLRAIGDVSNETLTWLSPFGWIEMSQPYVVNRWQPVLLTFGVALLLHVAAFLLNEKRDFASGYLKAKPGKTHAGKLLSGPFSLLFRLQRTSLIAWTAGMVLLGAMYGSVLGDLEKYFQDNEMLQQILAAQPGFSLVDQSIGMLMFMLAIFASIPALMALLKLQGEEKKARLDLVYSLPQSRLRLMLDAWAAAVMIGTVMLLIAALGLAAAGNAVLDDPVGYAVFMKAAAVYLPAIWTLLGIAGLLIGILPKWSGLIWAYVAYAFIAVYMGDLLKMPGWLRKLSPFEFVPQIPVEKLHWGELSFLALFALIVFAAGLAGYRRRDLQG